MNHSNIDRQKIAQEWLKKGFSCQLWIDPPGQVWNDFNHEYDELFMVVEGLIELEIDGEVHRPKIGEEWMIPAHTPHTLRNNGRRTAQWLYGYPLESLPGD